MLIHNNIAAMNATRNYKMNIDKKTKSTEKLSSGFRVSKSADDASGLAISEKMRSQIRGLNKAVSNLSDALSRNQTADGALQGITDVMQRMRELSLQANNDTLSAEDKAALQFEFDALQTEIDDIANKTKFNEDYVFEEHEETYFSIDGNRIWPQNQEHRITDSTNSMSITYKKTADGPEETISFSVANGTYTTQELIDEIDDAVRAVGADEIGFNLELTGDGLVRLNYESGEHIVSAAGGLSYLFFGAFDSGTVGALLGTTQFRGDNPLNITSSNNQLSFDLVDFYGNSTTVDLTLATRPYSRSEIIDALNAALDSKGLTNVRASEHGAECVKITSEDYFVTSLKGNMFKLDDPAMNEPVYTSVFYDNIKYGMAYDTQAVFRGGAVIRSPTYETEFSQFNITDENKMLSVRTGSGDYKEIELAKGKYTYSQMSALLDTAMDSLGLDVTYYSAGSGTNTFYGFQITSRDKGESVKVDFDRAASTAYNTLFTDRISTTNNTVNPVSGAYDYRNSAFALGGRSHVDPFEITESNNEFRITLECTGRSAVTKTLKLDNGTYNNADEILDEIRKQLANEGIGDRVVLSSEDGRIKFSGSPDIGSETTRITLAAVAGDSGYSDLFNGIQTQYTNVNRSDSGTASEEALVTGLHIPEIGTVIDSSNDRFRVVIDGVTRDVTLDHGTVDANMQTAIIGKLNAALGYTATDKAYTLTNIVGETKSDSSSVQSKVTPSGSWSSTANGTGTAQQGSTDTDALTPAVLNFPGIPSGSLTIGENNKTFAISINGNTVSFDLQVGKTYTVSELRDAIQTGINTQLPGSMGADVTINGSTLRFTSRAQGKDAQIKVTASNSSFVSDVTATRTAATAYLSLTTQSSITIDGTNNKMTFKYNGNDVTLTLAGGSYTRSSFATAINNSLKNAGLEGKVTATVSSTYLALSTNVPQNSNDTASIEISTDTMGAGVVKALFGELHTSGTSTVSLAAQTAINIDSSSNQFTYTYYDTAASQYKTETVNLNNGSYTRDTFKTMLNGKLNHATADFNSSGQLVLTAKHKGTNSAVRYGNTTGTGASYGNSHGAIFGKNESTGLKAEVDASGNVTLTGLQKGSDKSIIFRTSDGEANLLFLDRTESDVMTYVTAGTGSLLYNTKANIDGANLSGSKVQITELNKALSFAISGTGYVSFELDEGSYTFKELQDALQDKIDNSIAGAGKYNVRVDGNGVRIEATTPSNNTYNMSSFTGGFYKYVISGNQILKQSQAVSNNSGQHVTFPAYAIGRQDVRNNEVEIIAGANDQLTLDFVLGENGGTAQRYSVSITLDTGVYKGVSLAQQVQGKLNEQFAKMGLAQNTIQASIGGYDSGVVGSNDKNALIFRIDGRPSQNNSGEYLIDGISGNASFYIFYKTDGSPIPTYLQGAADISKGVTITDKNNTFSFMANDVKYEFELEQKEYTADEIISHLNDLFAEEAAANPDFPPLVALLSDNNLKISFTKFGSNTLNSVAGYAKGDLFYNEHGRNDGENGLIIQSGANKADELTIIKKRMNSVALGVNSIVLSSKKYIEKALTRIDEALNTVQLYRAQLGAQSNRMEMKLAGNEITFVNLQAGESRIRDIDMARESANFVKSSILSDTSIAMASQANMFPDSILKLIH